MGVRWEHQMKIWRWLWFLFEFESIRTNVTNPTDKVGGQSQSISRDNDQNLVGTGDHVSNLCSDAKGGASMVWGIAFGHEKSKG
jgi:hypothetical protein